MPVPLPTSLPVNPALTSTKPDTVSPGPHLAYSTGDEFDDMNRADLVRMLRRIKTNPGTKNVGAQTDGVVFDAEPEATANINDLYKKILFLEEFENQFGPLNPDDHRRVGPVSFLKTSTPTAPSQTSERVVSSEDSAEVTNSVINREREETIVNLVVEPVTETIHHQAIAAPIDANVHFQSTQTTLSDELIEEVFGYLLTDTAPVVNESVKPCVIEDIQPVSQREIQDEVIRADQPLKREKRAPVAAEKYPGVQVFSQAIQGVKRQRQESDKASAVEKFKGGTGEQSKRL